eukprot:5680139-Amphidinium_carterae.1
MAGGQWPFCFVCIFPHDMWCLRLGSFSKSLPGRAFKWPSCHDGNHRHVLPRWAYRSWPGGSP